MTISVIIPVHNSESYLDECIKSVLKGLKDDDELILVENGSKDGSWEMCREYAANCANVKAVQLDTAGVSKARNKGIFLAEKYWVVFLDSDDVMAPSFLEEAHEVPADADIVLYDYCFLDEAQDHVDPEDTGYREVSPDLLKRAALQFGKYQKQVKKEANLDNVTIWTSCGRLIRRDFLLENHIVFPEELVLSEDTVFSFQTYCCAGKILFSRRCAFFYRRTPQSASRISHPRTLENNEYLRKWLYHYVKKNGIYTELKEEVSAFLSRKFIEECLYIRESNKDKESKIQYVREKLSRPFMKKTIYYARYSHLIAGKKNSLLYGTFLVLLKTKKYGLLFIGSNKESV